MALTDYDKKNLSGKDQKKIQAATDKWNAANAKGDKAGMAAAAAEAAAVRNNAGYKTDSSGNYSGSYTPTSSGGSSYGGSSGGLSSGGNSKYTGSSTAITTNNSTQQAIKDTMNANSIAWWSADEAGKKQLEAENQRLAAILGGSVSYDPTTGTWSGSAQKNNATKDDILRWEYDEVKPTAPQDDPRVEEYLNKILNREDFSYDAMNDPLYQQYAKMYQREGDRAMKETMAEAAAGAGGMNTYAITAAQQANSYYNSQLNDRIPQLYQLAYDMYLNDKESMVQDLGLIQDMSDRQYNRYRDTMNDWYNDKSFAYGIYNDAVQQGNWQSEFDYKSMWDNINFNNGNYWKEKEYTDNRADIEYNRNKDDQDSTKAIILAAIEDGATSIAPELIAKSGLTQEEVNLLITARQASKGKSSGGSDRRIGSDGEDGVEIPKSELANIMTEQEWYSRRGSHEMSGSGGIEVAEYSTYKEYYEAMMDYLKLKYSEN